MGLKLYTGPILDVSDERELCVHAAECVRGMPEVFNVSERPWVNPTHADTPELADKLRAVVARCPHHALKIVEHTS
ncbi:MAG: (4Fe-4S)-binding protein [Propionibacteriaceae bacterium]|jgi:uncharacterized Fe-S cluster protein YjdI|nr:(4Fe-4S)-binding protein [Propionibacteriaceae bacterium]